MKSALLFLFIFIGLSPSYATKALPEGIQYEKRQDNHHVIHILTVDPQRYHLELVRAHDQVFGRETVLQMAQRKGAIAAINGGFFEIGGNKDGYPSGSLVIKGTPFAILSKQQCVLSWSREKLTIADGAKTEIEFFYHGQKIPLDGFNQYTTPESVTLYHYTWGVNTLTPHDRIEVLINKDKFITHIYRKGDNLIPENGWVLSFPRKGEFPPLNIGDRVRIETKLLTKDEGEYQPYPLDNLLRGIPILIEKGKVSPKLQNSKSNFVRQPHARTALGTRSNGQIIIVVVEHKYAFNLPEVNLKQIQGILRNGEYNIEELKLPELRKIVEDYLTQDSSIVGLSLPDLAQLMVELGCQQAINLDGGGSSTLYLQDNIMNTAFGDQDESMGQRVSRAVSDAIAIMPGGATPYGYLPYEK